MPEHPVPAGANQELMDGSELASRAKETGNCSSWVVEMGKLLEDTRPSVEMARWKQRSIYRVPEFIKDITNSKAYQPKFMSLGPYHHGEPRLMPMEEHKRRAVLHMVKRAGKPLEEFVAAIEEVADELEATYDVLDEDKWRGVNRRSFVEMMVTDGCFLLELLKTTKHFVEDEENGDYAANDPIFSTSAFFNWWPIMLPDMIAIENQLPLVVLERLLAVQHGTSPLGEGIHNLGLHFLDIYHKSYCGARSYWGGSDFYESYTPCAVELSEAGIQLNKSNMESIHDVDFQNSVLTMPLFEPDDGTETILLNLMVFEWLHPNYKRDVVSYIWFMDQIIESERDVALLRSKGLVANGLGTDKRVVEMFNTLTKLSRPPLKGSRLGHLAWKLNAHCKKRRNKWRAIFVNTYLSNPWVFISLVAAVILLIATIMQTIYTVVPFYTNKG